MTYDPRMYCGTVTGRFMQKREVQPLHTTAKIHPPRRILDIDYADIERKVLATLTNQQLGDTK